MVDVTLTLGQIKFANSEIPAKIAIGGSQRIAVHQLVGGAKVVDAMGREDVPLGWGGYFLGANAVQRARYLDGLRISGVPQKLTWGEFSYQVIVRDFHADFERKYKLPYTISCEVIVDNNSPVTSSKSKSLLGQLQDDLNEIMGFVDLINDNPLTQAMSQFSAALSQIPTTTYLSSQVSLPLVTPAFAAVNRLTFLQNNTETQIQASPAVTDANSLNNEIQMLELLINLMNAAAMVKRTLANVNSNTAGSTGKTITVSGGTLYQVAAQYYGDATMWYDIGIANGIYDPVLTGPTTLILPGLN